MEDLNHTKAGSTNASRDMLRAFLRTCPGAPPLRDHEITVWDKKQKHSFKSPLPFLHLEDLLPRYFQNHPDLLQQLCDHRDVPHLAQNLAGAKARANLPPGSLVAGLGLHGDGVTMQRKKSLEVVSVNFPRMPGWDRIPIFALEKQFVCKCGCQGRCTWNDILMVVSDIFHCTCQRLLRSQLAACPGEG